MAYQTVLTGEGVGMNPTAVGWLILIQFLVVFCTHSHPPQLCHSTEMEKSNMILLLGGLCCLAATADALPPCQESLCKHTSPPRMLLTTDALFENQMWKRLVQAGASSALDTWMGTKGQNCVSVFQTQLNLETQHAPDHQDQIGIYENREKIHFKVTPELKILR